MMYFELPFAYFFTQHVRGYKFAYNGKISVYKLQHEIQDRRRKPICLCKTAKYIGITIFVTLKQLITTRAYDTLIFF